MPAGGRAGRRSPRPCSAIGRSEAPTMQPAGPGVMRSNDKAEVPALPTPALEGRQPRASESA